MNDQAPTLEERLATAIEGCPRCRNMFEADVIRHHAECLAEIRRVQSRDPLRLPAAVWGKDRRRRGGDDR